MSGFCRWYEKDMEDITEHEQEQCEENGQDCRECPDLMIKEQEAAAPEKRCSEGIVNILKAAVEEIYTGGLAKVTLNLRGGVKASISQNSKGEINVERTETKKQKLTE